MRKASPAGPSGSAADPAPAAEEAPAPAEDGLGEDAKAVVGLAGASRRTGPALQPERAAAADSRPASPAEPAAADTL